MCDIVGVNGMSIVGGARVASLVPRETSGTSMKMSCCNGERNGEGEREM